MDGGEGAFGIVPAAGLELHLSKSLPDSRVCGVGHQVGPQALLGLQQLTSLQVGDGQVVGGLDPVAVDFQSPQISPPGLVGLAGGVVGQAQMIESRGTLREIQGGPLQQWNGFSGLSALKQSIAFDQRPFARRAASGQQQTQGWNGKPGQRNG